MHLSLVVLYLFCWTGRVSSSPRTQIGLVRCLINGLFFVFVFVCNQSIRQRDAQLWISMGHNRQELKRTCQNISTGYYPRVYTSFSPLQWQRITCTQCYLCLDGVFLFYRFNVVLTMRNREEALAHCRARRVYILQSPPHCLHPPSHAANAISSLYNSYSFFLDQLNLAAKFL